MGKGMSANELIEEGSGDVCGCAACDGPFGDGIVCGQVFDVAARREADKDGVDLNDQCGTRWGSPWQAARMTPDADQAEAAATRPAAPGRDRLDQASPH